MDFAFAKLQGLNGESFYIQNLPTKICRKVRRDKEDGKGGIDTIPISDSHGIAQCHCLVSYDEKTESFFLIPFGGVYVDNQFYDGVENVNTTLIDFFANPSKDLESYDQQKVKLSNYSKIYFPTEDTEIPLVFYLIFPKTGNSSILRKDHDNFLMPAKLTAPKNKLAEKLLGTKWSADDKEQLKKFLLIFGYGRWKLIQEASKQIQGKLKEKPIGELRAFSNAFIRCIIEEITVEKDELRNSLLAMLEEGQDDPYIVTNAKDWGPILLKQRANTWAKRFQLMYRIKQLIKKFKEEQRKVKGIQKSKDMQWDHLLNFIPAPVWYGQRPSHWWTKRHDIDLLRGTHKLGYANYHLIKNDPRYSFQELEKVSTYSEFPNADTVTRRLKKLSQLIGRQLEGKEGPLDFETQEEKEFEGWELEEKKKFFKFVNDFGIPLNAEGKPNWMEIREKATKEPIYDLKNFNKNITEIEMFIDKLRLKCAQIADSAKEGSKQTESDEIPDLKVSLEEAQRFNKNSEMLYFIRRGILSNKMALLVSGIDELKKATQDLAEGELGSVPEEYDPGFHDKNLLLNVSDFGLLAVEKLAGNKEFGFENIKMTAKQITERLEFVCEFFKTFLNQQNSKKKRSGPILKDDSKKKQKFLLAKDEEGNIIYPLVINPSLTLYESGVINVNPNYHSEHNLFPVGYKSVRAHASIFEKGKRALYTNEILEGPEGKPLYRVTSSEDPENPIVKDSSTGCWVYICQRVNDLADVKKQKVTISGTERFGLLEPNVCRILEYLPNAEKCSKYKFKYREIGDPIEEEL